MHGPRSDRGRTGAAIAAGATVDLAAGPAAFGVATGRDQLLGRLGLPFVVGVSLAGRGVRLVERRAGTAGIGHLVALGSRSSSNSPLAQQAAASA